MKVKIAAIVCTVCFISISPFAAEARKVDFGDVTKAITQVGETVRNVQTITETVVDRQPAQLRYSAQPRYSAQNRQYVSANAAPADGDAPSRGFGKPTDPKFRQAMGPKARAVDDAAETVINEWIKPVVDWAVNRDSTQRLLFVILLLAAILLPLIVVYFAARREPGTFLVMRSVGGLAALAGAVCTVWGGFEIGGDAGEWMALAIMVLLGLSALVALIGGMFGGGGIVYRIFAPFILLEISAVAFVLAMLAAVVFIIIAIIFIVLQVLIAGADANTVYKCSNCGRTFRGKPSSCPCGAVFD